MARYGTREHEDDLMALELEDREVFGDEPSGGHYAELGRLAALDLANEGRDDQPPGDWAAFAATIPTCNHDGHAPEDCLPLPF